jgi:hypothetical protein
MFLLEHVLKWLSVLNVFTKTFFKVVACLTWESYFFPQLGIVEATITLSGNELLTSVLSAVIVSLLIVMLTLEPALTQFDCLPRGLMLASMSLLGTVIVKIRFSHLLGNKDDVSRLLLPYCYITMKEAGCISLHFLFIKTKKVFSNIIFSLLFKCIKK